MTCSLTFAIIVLTLSLTSALKWRSFIDPVVKTYQKQKQLRTVKEMKYNWTERYYESMPVDHFSKANSETFRLRYLLNDQYFTSTGTIFFYTGNEGPIEEFATATGIMWDLAPKFNAALVFGEHRYYGKSLPYGNESYDTITNIGYLNSIQALADFADLIIYIKSTVLNCSSDIPVIAFGGSYGGMLTAWMRIKYPHIIKGAWSASAPLMYFKGGDVSWGAFDNVTTRTFVDSGCSREAISKGFMAIRNLGKTNEGRNFLNELFHIEDKSKIGNETDAESIVVFVREAIEYLGMVDYPYSTGFLEPLPSWPVKEFCNYVKQSSDDDKVLVTQLYNAANVYYNYTGNQKTYCVIQSVCGDTATSALGSPLAWPWQACTEQILNTCAMGGENDMFFDECKNYDEESRAYCRDTFGKKGYRDNMYQPESLPHLYGLNFAASSNIIFTNGYLDPWSSGGVYEDSPGIKDASPNGVYTFMINAAAHHLDLRQPNSCDPPPVRNARYQIVNILECYVYGCEVLPKAQPLPPEGSKESTNCVDEIAEYPWGQASNVGTRFAYDIAIHFIPLTVILLNFR